MVVQHVEVKEQMKICFNAFEKTNMSAREVIFLYDVDRKKKKNAQNITSNKLERNDTVIPVCM
jgi:hypothetical protein